MTHPHDFASRVLIRALIFCAVLSLISAPLHAMNPVPQLLAQHQAWLDLKRDNNQLAQDVLANPELAQALGEKPELIDHVAAHPNLIQLVQANPGLIAFAVAHPQHVPQVVQNPQKIPALIAQFGKAQQAAAQAQAGTQTPAAAAAQAAGAPQAAPTPKKPKNKAGQQAQAGAAGAAPAGAAPAGSGANNPGFAFNMARQVRDGILGDMGTLDENVNNVVGALRNNLGTPEEILNRSVAAARQSLGTPEEILNRTVAATRQSLGTPEENMARIAQAIQQFMQEAQAGGPAAPGQLNGEGRAALRAALQAFVQEIGRMLQAGFAAGGDMEQGMGEAVNAVGRALRQAVRNGADLDQAGAEGIAAFNRQIVRFMEGLEAHLRNGGSLDNFFQAGAGNLDRNLGRFGDALMHQIGDGGQFRRAINEMQRVAVANTWEFASMGVTFLKYTTFISALGYFSYFTSEYGLRVFWNYVDRKIQQPKLLIASSQPTFLEKLHITSRPKEKPVEMVLSPEQEERFKEFEAALQITRKRVKEGKKDITYRWLCMAGPPGTGKTMKARDLARKYGMDFAEITGASLSQFKNGTAITEIDKLFTWAKSESDKGVVIFIDEVDSLLTKRELLKADSEEYKIVNHILNHTGDRSDRFMLIMTTNHVEGLDQAIYDRVDDFVMMGLPDKAHRERVLMFYINKVFLNPENDESVVEHARAIFTPEFVGQLALKTDGYSNRSLHGFINMLYGNTLIARDCKITPELVNRTLAQMAQKMKLMAAVSGSKPAVQAAMAA